MVVLRVAVLCGCGLALGGCLSNGGTPGVGAGAAPLAVSSVALPPTTEPGQLLKPGLGGIRGGVNPSAELLDSERARVAWSPLQPDRLNRPPTLSAHSANLLGPGDARDPTGTASVTPAARSGTRTGTGSPARDAEAALDRLQREGHRDGQAVCQGC